MRCIRIHTNIDLTKVRFNSVQYNIRDLESKIFVPERNQLIVDTTRQIKDTVTTLKKSATNYLNTQFKNEIAYGKKLKSAIKDRIQLYEAKKAELNELSCMYLKKIFEDCLDDLEIPEFMES